MDTFCKDRIYNLNCVSLYPGEDSLDMVFDYPKNEGLRLYLWLKTKAEDPLLFIDDLQFRKERSEVSSGNWLFMGETTEISGSFALLRLKGMTFEEAQDSYLLITATSIAISGTISDVETVLFGISREDAGSSLISPSKIPVGEPVQYTLSYRAGSMGLPPGSRIKLEIPYVFSMPQTVHNDGEGYISAYCQDQSPVLFESIQHSSFNHETIDVILFLKNGLTENTELRVSYYSLRTYLFPAKFSVSGRKYWYTKLPPLHLTVAVNHDQKYIPLKKGNAHNVEYVQGRSERLHLFVKGRIKNNSSQYVLGLFTDKYRNYPPLGGNDCNIHLFIETAGEVIPLGSPKGYFEDFYRFRMPLPHLESGVYRIKAVDHVSAKTIAVSNPLEIMDNDSHEPEIFWGEIHGHTEMSDGMGRYNDLYRSAKEDAFMDFAAACDHAEYFTDNQWLLMQDITNKYNEPGSFISLPAYEWAGKHVHRNIYTWKDNLKLFRGKYEPTSRLDVVWAYFKGDDSVVGGPHGSTTHGLEWDAHDPDVERFIEIYSMWGASDFMTDTLLPSLIPSNAITVNELLQGGAHLGFTGGGDCHEGKCGFSCEDPQGQGTIPHTFAKHLLYKCGMTAALLPELNRKCLIDAIRNRRTYATTGARIIMSFSVAGFPMGELGQADHVSIKATVHGCSRIQTIEVIKDGDIVHKESCNALDLEFTWDDSENPYKEHYYYIRVIQADGEMAWASPVWIQPL